MNDSMNARRYIIYIDSAWISKTSYGHVGILGSLTLGEAGFQARSLLIPALPARFPGHRRGCPGCLGAEKRHHGGRKKTHNWLVVWNNIHPVGKNRPISLIFFRGGWNHQPRLGKFDHDLTVLWWTLESWLISCEGKSFEIIPKWPQDSG